MVLKRKIRYEISDLIEEIDAVLPKVNKELENRKQGIPGYGEIEQLEAIKEELEEIKKMALENKLPPKGERWVKYAWYFTHENWKIEPSIEEELWDIADIYHRKLKE